MLHGKKILLGITGSIAAYKAAIIVRLLVKNGAEVKVVVTPSTKLFISPLTLSTLSKNPVLSELADNTSWTNHVMLGRWADVMLIAPVSCNTIAKMANGICDNLLLAVYLSATCKVMAAPAMDEDMWHHPSTQRNISKLKEYGNYILPVDNGELASGLTGDGRMAEPEAIVTYLNNYFAVQDSLSGKKVLVTAGPTYEPIDPVRFIGNHSSGKMGIALAEVCRERGAQVTLIIGPTSQVIPTGMNVVHVSTASEMFKSAIKVFPETDMAIMCAAVADYSIKNPATQKIKKSGDTLLLELEKTPDILKALGELKKDHQCLVGFALETNNEKENALKKLHDKKADFIILNSLKDEGAGFGHDTNKVCVFSKNGKQYEFAMRSKKEIAAEIITTILKHTDA
ncbi:MAG: bifunctional phosphopantothenoylcysteine decarboxylase/phosphopantothenate--cysteine ligase CoaBC [Ferruginibacter sp.]